MTGTIHDVQATLDDRLRRAGVFEIVERGSRKVVDVPDGFFAELVIADVSRRPDVEKAVKSAQEDLKQNNIVFEVLIRPTWRVGDLRYLGPSVENGNAFGGSLRFSATLVSGNQQRDASIEVSPSGLDVIREKLGKQGFLGKLGWKPDSGDVNVGYVERVVRSFLEAELKAGGEAYWDPTKNPERKLDAAALSFLLGTGTAFRDLRNAMDDAFDPYAVTKFLEHLSATRKNPKNLDDILTELSGFLGGPYTQGQTFETSAVDLYNRLRPAEQELLRYHFETLTDSALAKPS